NNACVVFGATVAIGKDNFESIIGDHLTFVDKSILIKEFIESLDFVSLVLHPRRFGKKLFEKLKVLAEIEIMEKHFA
ncbi:10324_t:CDS:2, partial [Gigaspora rosea]